MKKSTILIFATLFFIDLSAQNVGIGTPIPVQKLDVAGNIKLSGALMPGGIAGTAGQVLVSNGVGTPTWNSAIAFKVIKPANQTLNNGTTQPVVFTEDFDESDVWNAPFFRFEAPQSGIYHFDAAVKWESGAASSYVEMNIEKCNASNANCTNVAQANTNNILAPQLILGIDLKLVAGDIVRVTVFQQQGSNRDIINTAGTYFSGHLVR